MLLSLSMEKCKARDYDSSRKEPYVHAGEVRHRTRDRSCDSHRRRHHDRVVEIVAARTLNPVRSGESEAMSK